MAITASLGCSDPLCSDPTHSTERDDHVLDILCSIVESSHTKLPLAGGRRAAPANSKSGKVSGGNIPGWNEEVEPFRQDSLFWHEVWISAGKPNTGQLYIWKNHTRNLLVRACCVRQRSKLRWPLLPYSAYLETSA